MSRSLILPSSSFYIFDDETYALGEFPFEGCLLRITPAGPVLVYAGGIHQLQWVASEEGLLNISADGKLLVGQQASTLDKYKALDAAFYDSGAQTYRCKDNGQETNIFVDGEEEFSIAEKMYLYRHVNDVFIGELRDESAIVGIQHGEMVWRVSFDRPKDFDDVYPPLRQHHFYLCENKLLQCYDYHGGQLAWQHPLAELPLTLLEFDRRTVIQTPSEVISFTADGQVLGQKAMAGGGDMHTGNHLLGNDHLFLYVADREVGALVVYDYALQEQHRITLLENYDPLFQRVSPELNVLSLERVKQRIIGSKHATFWHPDDTLTLASLLSEEDNFRVERVEQGGKSSYDVYIDSDNKHDFFRLADVIVLDVANKYGDDYCDPDVDRQFAGDIRLIVNDELYQQERDFLATMQQRLVNIIKENGGVMHSGVVSGDKQRHIDVQIVALADV
ncbi:hypothetical protein GCM10011297_16090 [Bacterioplanes sanyensis]|uniref:hypothetical protein n=1 Tax=Bacterioplanes sanyensis TaxID=1249553 RepID=UPI001671AE63|nr:hypothetical protein [Bacterioplanes sanyensis]GGY43956.1 hypothetical protein GCM10011297_16090 [Bacterioplanes sanyensis]